MKIINNTGNFVQYLVTPSGTTLSGSTIVASGSIRPNSAEIFPVNNGGPNPIVYVKSIGQGSKGYTGRQVADANSTVALTITEV
ncbi:MAG TPA: hypothetical protein VEG34_03255 [Thermoanaerobaculia bacterium]|nr:hypothetical protein [Thermoanaerobaculia bacterium]